MPRRIRQVACNCCFIITVSLVAFMIPRHCFAQVSMPALRSINGKLKAAEKSKRWKDVKRHSEELLRLTSENVIRRAALNDSDKKLVKLYHESGRYYLSVVVGQWAIDGLTARINGEEQKAEELFQDVLEMSRRLYGKQHKTFADALDYLGCTKRDLSKFDEAEPLLKQSLSIRTRLFGTTSTRVADSRVELAMLYARTAQYEDAVERYTDAIETYQRHTPKENEKLAGSLNGLAILYFRQGQYAAAEPLLQRALKIREKVHGLEHPDVADSLNNLAILYSDQGQYAAAEPLYQRALKIYEKVHGAEHPAVANSLNSLANLYARQGQYAAAEPLHQRSLKIREKVLGAEHPRMADSLNNLALLYVNQGQYAAAEPLHQRSLKIREKVHGAEHPEVADSLINLASLYSDQGQYVAAEPLYQRALKIYEKVHGAEHPAVANSLNNLANLYVRQGQYAAAEPLHQRALKIREKVLGAEHPAVAASLNNLALLYEKQGEYADAEPLNQRSLKIYEKVHGSEHPAVAVSLANLANLYVCQGQYTAAEPLHQRALKIREKVLGAEHPAVAISLNNLAILYADQGQYVEAESLIDRAILIQDSFNASSGARSGNYKIRAEIVWKQGRQSTAVADLREAMRLAELQRTQTAGAERDQARAFAEFASAFETMVGWQAELGDVAEAFSAAERGRAQSLQDQMAVGQIDLLAGLPPAQAKRLRQQDSDAKTRITSLQKQFSLLNQRKDLTDLARKQQREELQIQLMQARDDAVQAYGAIRNVSPAYRVALGEDRQPVSLEKLQSRVAAADGLFLEYVLGTEGGYLFVIPAEGNARAVKLTINDSQAKALGTTAGPLTAERLTAVLVNEQKTGVLDLLKHPQRAKDATTKLAVLYELLIPETERQTLTDDKFKSLIVVSDGPLALLPFETLVVKGEADPTYLLDVGPPIHYAPSATVLDNLAKRNMSRSSRRSPVLTVADPAYDGSRNSKFSEADVSVLEQLTARSRYGTVGGRLQRLPYSATESRWVADVFGKNKLRVGQLLGSKATESQLRFNASDRHILHLACHGLVDQEYGNFFGALALTPGPNTGSDTANDGFLTLPEIYELNLQGCELAILSACDTNYGPHQQGEGVWALSRGFLVAGARRVVASNWLVDDEAAASLISYFCAGVAQKEGSGQTPNYSASLQAAKKWVRAQQKWSSPYYWGTFVLVGPE